MTLFEYLEYSFNINNYSVPYNTKGITKDSLLKFIESGASCHRGALGYSSASGWRNFIKQVFFDKISTESYKTFLLAKIDLKQCSVCEEVLHISLFNRNKGKSGGLQHCCKSCEREIQRPKMRAYMAYRKAKQLQATPPWVDLKQISAFYNSCPPNFQVDHIVPLNHPLVSGLHCLANLQYLSASDNLKKSNKFEI